MLCNKLMNSFLNYSTVIEYIMHADSASSSRVIFDSTFSMSHYISPLCSSLLDSPLSVTSGNKKHSPLHHCAHFCHITHSESFTLNLTTATLCFSIFPSLNSVASNSTAWAGSKFWHIIPVLKSFNWLKIEQLIQYKIEDGERVNN
jgi:hypothetical protein